MDFFQFSVPTKIVFNAGLSKDFGQELDTLGVDSVFIVTDAFLKKSGLIDPIIEGLKSAGKEVKGIFSEVPPDSGVSVIEKCAAEAKASGAGAILAIGGGSVLDTAKGTNLLFSLGGNLVEDYSGAQTVTQDLAPLIAIPTTAGTGSEVTEAMVILDEKTHTKLSFVDSHLLPKLAVLDPELTLGLPPLLTAATAMDALTHSIEAVMSVQRGPASNAFALQAISLIKKSILKAVQDGSDLDARGDLLIAATLAGVAFNHAMVGVVHSVAHTVGALARVHHGTANSIFLPYGMEYNLDVREAEIASLARSLDVSPKKSDRETALACIEAVRQLQLDLEKICGLPSSYSKAGVSKDLIGKIAEKAPEDGSSFYNPRELTSDDLMPYLERAF